MEWVLGFVIVVGAGVALVGWLISTVNTSEANGGYRAARQPAQDAFAVTPGRMQLALFDGDGDFDMECVGEANYQAALKATLAQGGRELPCILRPEPENPHDSKAVAVLTSHGTVAYLPREAASEWHDRVVAAWRREGGPVGVMGRIYQGRDGICGIWLDWPTEFDG